MQSPIITALCSYGMSGKVFHAPLLHYHQGFQLHGVYERSADNARLDYLGITRYTSLEDMLADEAIELVVVNTPNSSHYEYTKKALQANKHVVVEKPFVATVAQANEINELAFANGKKLAVYHNRRYDSDFLTVKKIIEEKRIGDVVEAEFHFDRFKQEISPKQHKETPGDATGIVYDLGSHIIDQALYLFGMPEAVFADIFIMRPISKVDDYFEILLYYPGKRVRLKGGYQVKHPVPSFIVHGTLGSFLKERADVQEANLQAGLYKGPEGWGAEPASAKGILNTIADGKETLQQVETLTGNYTLFYDKIFEAIRNDAPVPVSAEEGKNVIAIIEAAFKSSNERRVITL
ncbi:Gfo/Idh/MocA family oxidoreductase [Aridibaculum aurantiacum]|uniref:Gfo/Idh/MocA family oxidoreductase n=1 Tax=Aridibaculum aurantiacum TaxID=2810307 RepID=UPI001A95F0D4|nr:Gfo/Idh/MocA family oxidoreductase [Aridibaculum aurantiacum]